MMAVHLASCGYGVIKGYDNWVLRGMIGSGITAVTCLLMYPIAWLSNFQRWRDVSWGALGLLLLQCLTVTFYYFSNHSIQVLDDYYELPLILVQDISYNQLIGILILMGLYFKRHAALRLPCILLIVMSMVHLLVHYVSEFLCVFFNMYTLGLGMDDINLGVFCLSMGFAALLIKPWRWTKIIGLLAGVSSMLVYMLDVCYYEISPQIIYGLGIIPALICFFQSYCNVLGALPMNEGWLKHIRRGSVFLMTLAMLCLAIGYLWNVPYEIQLRFGHYGKLFGLFSMVLTFVFIFKLTIDHVHVSPTPTDTQLRYDTLTLTCPQCQTQQSRKPGEACSHCGLRIHFGFTEPHCPKCDYLLIGKVHGNCPECGYPIEQENKVVSTDRVDATCFGDDQQEMENAC